MEVLLYGFVGLIILAILAMFWYAYQESKNDPGRKKKLKGKAGKKERVMWSIGDD